MSTSALISVWKLFAALNNLVKLTLKSLAKASRVVLQDDTRVELIGVASFLRKPKEIIALFVKIFPWKASWEKNIQK